MKETINHYLITLCSLLIFLTVAIVLAGDRFRKNYQLNESNDPPYTSPNSLTQFLFTKALAISSVKSFIDALFSELKEHKYLRLEHQQLIYKITDFRMELLLPTRPHKDAFAIRYQSREKVKSGNILLENGEKIEVDFLFDSNVMDGITVKAITGPKDPNASQISPYNKSKMQGSVFGILAPSQEDAESYVFRHAFKHQLELAGLLMEKNLIVRKV